MKIAKYAVNTAMKTPISYYGGKQQMAKHILPLIPEHGKYIEPFFGGGAIFWAKSKSKFEVINDYNQNVVHFYRVLKSNFFDLAKLIQETLHSRDTYKRALMIYSEPWLFDDFPIQRAWAFYVVTNQGFACKIGTWGYGTEGSKTNSVQNKIEKFSEALSERIKKVQIESKEAHLVMQAFDHEDSFFYVDPPYIGSNQGHYGGYEHVHFERDLEVMSNLKGKFLLSSYPSDLLDEYIEKNGWWKVEIDKHLSAGIRKRESRKMKREVLTANYPI